MSKVVLNDLNNLQNENSAVAVINGNNTTIENAFDNTISRDGSSPNSMNAPLDMNSNRILNLPIATSPTEPIRKQEFDGIVLNGMPTLAVGTTTTTAPGTNASVTNVGDDYNVVLNFNIPRGTPGNVNGPATSVVGNIATYGTTIGNVLLDSGKSLSDITTDITNLGNLKANKAGDTFTGAVNVPSLTATGTVAAASFTGSGTSLTGVETSAHAAATYSPILRTVQSQATSFTVSASNSGAIIVMGNSTTANITLPPNSSVPLPIGTQIDVIRANAGVVTFVAGSGVSIGSLSGLKNIANVNTAVTAVKTSTDTWYLVGTLA